MAEIRLANNAQEEAYHDSLANIFVLVKSVERLERAYVRDTLSAGDYEPACQKLLGQFKTLWNSIRDSVPDIDSFITRHALHCPMATHRLKAGVPATIEHGQGADSETKDLHVAVATAVSSFITTMDSIRLGMVAVDEISPLMKDLLVSLNKLTNLPADWAAKATIQSWVSKLHLKPATFELPEEDKRQILYDLETAYNELLNALSNN